MVACPSFVSGPGDLPGRVDHIEDHKFVWAVFTLLGHIAEHGSLVLILARPDCLSGPVVIALTVRERAEWVGLPLTSHMVPPYRVPERSWAWFVWSIRMLPMGVGMEMTQTPSADQVSSSPHLCSSRSHRACGKCALNLL